MRRLASLLLLAAMSFAGAMPACAQRIGTTAYERNSARASKHQQKMMKKAAKQQKKMLKKAQKAQNKQLKNAKKADAKANRNFHRIPQ